MKDKPGTIFTYDGVKYVSIAGVVVGRIRYIMCFKHGDISFPVPLCVIPEDLITLDSKG